jgi:hypothetical protein
VNYSDALILLIVKKLVWPATWCMLEAWSAGPEHARRTHIMVGFLTKLLIRSSSPAVHGHKCWAGTAQVAAQSAVLNKLLEIYSLNEPKSWAIVCAARGWLKAGLSHEDFTLTASQMQERS